MSKTRTELKADSAAKRISLLGILLSIAAILGYVEAILPISVGIPGIKLGLANVAILFVLYVYGFREAFLISVLRTVIIAFLFTNLSALLYSFGGAAVSLCAMAIVKSLRRGKTYHRDRMKEPETAAEAPDLCNDHALFSVYGVSALGGAVHNATQFVIAFLILGTPQIFGAWSTTYLPILLLSGLAAGIINALITTFLLKIKNR